MCYSHNTRHKAPPRSPISSWYSQLQKTRHDKSFPCVKIIYAYSTTHTTYHSNVTWMNSLFFFFPFFFLIYEKENPSTQEVYNGNPTSFCWMRSSSLHVITYIFNLHHLEYWICSEGSKPHWSLDKLERVQSLNLDK